MRLGGLKIAGFWQALCLRRWRERDDRHIFKGAATSPVDPIDELIRAVNEAQDGDIEGEHGLYSPLRSDRPSSFRRRRPDRR